MGIVQEKWAFRGSKKNTPYAALAGGYRIVLKLHHDAWIKKSKSFC